MNFTNKELKEYFIDVLLSFGWDRSKIRYLTSDGNETDLESYERVDAITLDGKSENIAIMFYDIHTSIFAYDVELMFIDDYSKGIYTSSDVFNNAVYEGCLRKLDHKEMLAMFSEIILCFKDSTYVTMSKGNSFSAVSKMYQYKQYYYRILVKNNRTEKENKIFENIEIRF